MLWKAQKAPNNMKHEHIDSGFRKFPFLLFHVKIKESFKK